MVRIGRVVQIGGAVKTGPCVNPDRPGFQSCSMNLVLPLALTAVCLGGETFFHAPRGYLGERAFSLRLSDGRVAMG